MKVPQRMELVEHVGRELDRLVSRAAGRPGRAKVVRFRATLERLAGVIGSLEIPGAADLAATFARAAGLMPVGETEVAVALVRREWDVWTATLPGRSPGLVLPAARLSSTEALTGSPPDPDDDTRTPDGTDTPAEDEVSALAADPEMATLFLAEAEDHLTAIEGLALRLEATPTDATLLNDVFRPFHTIKGNAGALGVVSLQRLAHAVESLLDQARSGARVLGPSDIEIVLRCVDLLNATLRDLAARLGGRPGTPLEAAQAQLLADIDRLSSSTLVSRNAPGGPGSAGRAAHDSDDTAVHDEAESALDGTIPARLPEAGRAGHASGSAGDAVAPVPVKVDTAKLDALIDAVGELVIVQSIIQADPSLAAIEDERLARNLEQLARITSDLQRSAMSMRMVPIKRTFQRMARLVRDLSRHAGKPVDLMITGEDTELDRKLVEDIADPLVHMVRNSLDHGIEPPDRRAALGKPVPARLRLRAFHEAGNVVVELSDDGAGLDTARILDIAVKRGLVSGDEPLTAPEIHQLIFRPGFSTVQHVTDISGRGVGMDVVRRNIETLRGRVDIQTVRGEGTTFSVKLPLTLAILDGLVLRIGGERYVMPAFSVRESLRPTASQVHAVDGESHVIDVRGRFLPYARLGDLLGVDPEPRPPEASTVVVMEDDGRQIALAVDEILRKQEVVVKALGQTFAEVRGVAGGAILGDGRIGLILDPAGVMSLMRRGVPRAA